MSSSAETVLKHLKHALSDLGDHAVAVKELEGKLLLAQRDLDDTTALLNSEKASNARLIETADRQTAEAKEMTEQLNSIREKVATIPDMEAANAELTSELVSARAEIENLNRKIQDLEDDAASMRKVSNVVTLENKVAKLTKENDALRKSLEKPPKNGSRSKSKGAKATIVAIKNDPVRDEVDVPVQQPVQSEGDKNEVHDQDDKKDGTIIESVDPETNCDKQPKEEHIFGVPVEENVPAEGTQVDQVAIGVPVESPATEKEELVDPPVVSDADLPVAKPQLKKKTIKDKTYMASSTELFDEEGLQKVADLLKENGRTKISWL